MKQIYAMRNEKNGMIYIGVTNVASYRIKHHLNSLLSGTHSNNMLQSDFDHYGFVFRFYLLESDVPDNMARDRERYWMNAYGSNRKGTGYNLSKQEKMKDLSKYKEIELKVIRGKLLFKLDEIEGMDKEEQLDV